MVFGFLHENETVDVSFNAGNVPQGVDTKPFFTDLRSDLESENTLIEIRRHFDRDGTFIPTPIWWLRKRIELAPLDASRGIDSIDMRFTHHTESGRDALSDAFEEVAKEVLPRIRAKHTKDWLNSIDARLGEIQLAVKEAEAERELNYRKDIPFIDESEQLENDREGISLDQNYLGYELGLPGTFGASTPWWKSPPKWAVFIGKCAGCGLMAVFPLMIILELMRPLRVHTE